MHEETREFLVGARLHQGPPYCPVMDNLTTYIQDYVPWCMLLANDVVLISQAWKQAYHKL